MSGRSHRACVLTATDSLDSPCPSMPGGHLGTFVGNVSPGQTCVESTKLRQRGSDWRPSSWQAPFSPPAPVASNASQPRPLANDEPLLNFLQSSNCPQTHVAFTSPRVTQCRRCRPYRPYRSASYPPRWSDKQAPLLPVTTLHPWLDICKCNHNAASKCNRSAASRRR